MPLLCTHPVPSHSVIPLSADPVSMDALGTKRCTLDRMAMAKTMGVFNPVQSVKSVAVGGCDSTTQTDMLL